MPAIVNSAEAGGESKTQAGPIAALAELLGDDGYLCPADNALSGWKNVLEDAFGEAGRGVAARARRRIRENYPRERGGEALEQLYQTLRGEK